VNRTLADSGMADAAGWYGKVSWLGDFAHRRLPADCLGAIDNWLSLAMQGAREQLGERWLDVYLTAPTIRFAWAPGIIDTRWWFGLLMPSCDSVGRYFPLVIAQARVKAPEDRIALDHLELWYEHMAQAALHTLNDEGGSLESLEAALYDAPPWPTPGRAPVATFQQGTGGQQLRLTVSVPLTHWLHGLVVQQLNSHLAACSVWWRVTHDHAGDTVDIIQGLPGGPGFAALLEGQPG
jgi:type VI secretion system protein ImpM